MLRKTVGTLWATVLAFMILALPAQAAMGDAPDTFWIRTGCAVLAGVGFGLRERLRVWLRRAIARLVARADRTADARFAGLVLAEPDRR